ncbi:16S rRNA pseudouridine(516) synthase RsuA [Salinibius halmophilus]|uniref:16S rRNA pseudouridine(516) synthase RsuA n=1 Tax=Salinibius halmophilus TaxID=1853216 RepID=UPI000E673C60|nr:16S rRNA pseudouridine(516) synthase RsuA [Salinibius halmophilus]
MRLDKFFSDATGMSRKDAKRQIGKGNVTCNGEVEKRAAYVVAEQDEIAWHGEQLSIAGNLYIMLNKPPGFVCSTADPEHPTVLELVDVVSRTPLHAAGRLDIDTTGLVLLTNDGQWSHRITSPQHQCEKRYRVELADPITDEQIKQLEQGVLLRNEDTPTLPAKVAVIDVQEILISISEGRYHQVKRMLAAVGNHVDALHREAIGPIELDKDLELGESRYLTDEEIVWVG